MSLARSQDGALPSSGVMNVVSWSHVSWRSSALHEANSQYSHLGGVPSGLEAGLAQMVLLGVEVHLCL